MRRASAAARHEVWVLGFAGVLLLPVLSAALPGWHVLPNPRGQRRNCPSPGRCRDGSRRANCPSSPRRSRPRAAAADSHSNPIQTRQGDDHGHEPRVAKCRSAGGRGVNTGRRVATESGRIPGRSTPAPRRRAAQARAVRRPAADGLAAALLADRQPAGAGPRDSGPPEPLVVAPPGGALPASPGASCSTSSRAPRGARRSAGRSSC